MKSLSDKLNEAIHDSDDEVTDKNYKDIPLTTKAGAVYASFKHFTKSNKGEMDIFGNPLKPGDFFVALNYVEPGWTAPTRMVVFYIPEDQREFQWGSHKELRAYQFGGNPGEDKSYAETTMWNKEERYKNYQVDQIPCKIKWPIKVK